MRVHVFSIDVTEHSVEEIASDLGARIDEELRRLELLRTTVHDVKLTPIDVRAHSLDQPHSKRAIVVTVTYSDDESDATPRQLFAPPPEGYDPDALRQIAAEGEA